MKLIYTKISHNRITDIEMKYYWYDSWIFINVLYHYFLSCPETSFVLNMFKPGFHYGYTDFSFTTSNSSLFAIFLSMNIFQIRMKIKPPNSKYQLNKTILDFAVENKNSGRIWESLFRVGCGERVSRRLGIRHPGNQEETLPVESTSPNRAKCPSTS